MSENEQIILEEIRAMRRDARETRDIVIEVRSQVESIIDHERRLRTLEKWRYGIGGTALLALGSIGAVLTEIPGGGG